MGKHFWYSIILPVVISSSAFAQLTSMCDALPRPNPQWEERTFQFPIEAGFGVKFTPDKPNPAVANIAVVPTFAVIQRTLRFGLGPEMLFSDLKPRYLGVARAVVDLWDLNIPSFNNIGIGSVNLFASVHAGEKFKTITSLGISLEVGRVFSIGSDWTYMNEEKRSALRIPLNFNPLFANRKPTRSRAPVAQNAPSDYYDYFRFQALTVLLDRCHYYDVERMSQNADESYWNTMADTTALKGILTNIGVLDRELVTDIMTEARRQSRMDHVTVNQEDQNAIIHAILKGFCQAIKGVMP